MLNAVYVSISSYKLSEWSQHKLCLAMQTVPKEGHWVSPRSRVCCRLWTQLHTGTFSAILRLNDFQVPSWDRLPFPDTSEVAGRCWLFNSIDFSLKEAALFMLSSISSLALLSSVSAPMKFPLSRRIFWQVLFDRWIVSVPVWKNRFRGNLLPLYVLLCYHESEQCSICLHDRSSCQICQGP